MKNKIIKPSKEIKREVAELQGVVHSQNLYRYDGRRVINPHLSRRNDETYVIVVEDLHSGAVYPFVRGEYRDGYGKTI